MNTNGTGGRDTWGWERRGRALLAEQRGEKQPRHPDNGTAGPPWDAQPAGRTPAAGGPLRALGVQGMGITSGKGLCSHQHHPSALTPSPPYKPLRCPSC